MQPITGQILDDDALQLAQLRAFLAVMLRVHVNLEASSHLSFEQCLHIRIDVTLLVLHVRSDRTGVFVIQFHYKLGKAIVLVKGVHKLAAYKRQLKFYVVSMACSEILKERRY